MYLPVRAFCEGLGAEVTWDDNIRTVNVELKTIDTANAGEELNAQLVRSLKAPDVVEAYAMVIDELYNTDVGLNDGIRYLAVDLSGVTYLAPREKKELIKLLYKKRLGVLDKTYDDLIKQHYITYIENEQPLGVFKDGILISISDKPMENDTVILTCDKYRSAYGAVGYGDIVMKYWNGNWVTTLYKNEGNEMGSSARPLVLSNNAIEKRPINFYLNGKTVKIDIEPYMVNGSMYLPVRAFCEALGAQVAWDDKNHSVNIEQKTIATYSRAEGPCSIPCQKASDLVKAYALVVDELYNLGNGPGMKFLAIDTTGMTNLTSEQRVELLDLLRKKYKLVILDKTQDQLIKEGYAKTLSYEGHPYWEYEKGLLIEIKDKPIEKNTIKMFTAISTNNQGCEGYTDLVIQYYDGYWLIINYGGVYCAA